MLLPGERELLARWSGTRTGLVPGTVPALFGAQVAATPDAVAVESGELTWTYAELDARANRIAQWLLARGAFPEARVAVRLKRSAGLVAALLGVAKAGCAGRGRRRPAVHRRRLRRTGRLYRTGDAVRLLPPLSPGAPHTVQYIDWVDRQVEISGARAELGEIEAVLQRHPDVGAVTVVVHKFSR